MKTRGVSTAEPVGLTVSIVVFRPEPAQLAQTLDSLAVACEILQAGGTLSQLYLIDNGGLPDDATAKCGVPCTVIAGQGNIGYGRGHNLAIEQAESRYHLVLNPDVDLERTALIDALHFLDEHQEVGLLAPCIVNAGGAMQYLCRRYPTLLDLFVRGFLPLAHEHFLPAVSQSMKCVT